MSGARGAVRRVAVTAVACTALLALPGCGAREGAGGATQLVFAVDGLEWDVVLPMLERGELPALRHLMERGRFGLLETLHPTLSPVIWTSIATGKPVAEPEIH